MVGLTTRHMHSRSTGKPFCNHSAGLTKEQVIRQYIPEAGWDAFMHWMRGQTVGMCSGCGCALYYLYDVARYAAGERYIWD